MRQGRNGIGQLMWHWSEGVPEEDILKIKQEKITERNAAIYQDTRLAAGYVPSDYPRSKRLFTGGDFQI